MKRYLNLLREQDLHGLLVTPTGGLDDLRVVASSGVPVVLLDRHAGERDFCSVAVDDVKGGQLAGSHLFEQGHRRIGFLNGPPTTQACVDRRKGIRAACRKAGLDVGTALVELAPGLNSAAGERGAEELLALDQPVTAIACVNDLVALGVLRTLNRHRVTVPDEIAVIGYDDVEFASELSTPLSSVAQPRYALGRTAADRTGHFTEAIIELQRRLAGWQELRVVRQHDRQIVFGDRHRAAIGAVDDRDRCAPVALTGDQPVA
jgi:LacI family transcriptional regulator